MFSMKQDYAAPVSPGRHICQVVKVSLGKCKPTSKYAGVDLLHLTYRVLPPDEDGGAQFDEYIVLCNMRSPLMGYSRLQAVCKAINPKMKGRAQSKSGFNPHELDSCESHLLGKTLAVETSTEVTSFTGDDGNEREWTRVTAGDCHQLTPQEADALREQHGTTEPEIVVDAPKKKAAPNGAPIDDGFDDSDIPF